MPDDPRPRVTALGLRNAELNCGTALAPPQSDARARGRIPAVRVLPGDSRLRVAAGEQWGVISDEQWGVINIRQSSKNSLIEEQCVIEGGNRVVRLT